MGAQKATGLGGTLAAVRREMVDRVLAVLEPEQASPEELLWLAAQGEDVVPTLLHIVESARTRSAPRFVAATRRAILLLGELRATAALEPLLEYLLLGQDPNPCQVALECALGQFGTAAFPVALCLLEAPRPQETKPGSEAVFQLMVDSGVKDPRFLHVLLEDLEREPRPSVAYLVGQYGDASAIPFFRACIAGWQGIAGFEAYDAPFIPSACAAIEALGGTLAALERLKAEAAEDLNARILHGGTYAPAPRPRQVSREELLEVLDKKVLFDEERAWLVAHAESVVPLLLTLLNEARSNRLRGRFVAAQNAIRLLQELGRAEAIGPMVECLLSGDDGNECLPFLGRALHAFGAAVVPVALLSLERRRPTKDLGLALLLDVVVRAGVQDPRLLRILIRNLDARPGAHAARLLVEYGDRAAIPFLELAISVWGPELDALAGRVIPSACHAIEALGGTLTDEARSKAQHAKAWAAATSETTPGSVSPSARGVSWVH